MSRKNLPIVSITNIVTLVLFTLTGCALIGLEEEEETTTEVADVGSLSDLEGTWASSCINHGSSSTNYTAIFSGTNYLLQLNLFLGESCSVTYVQQQSSYSNLSASGKATLSDNTIGYLLSYQVNTYTINPQHNSVVASYNGSSTCGKSDWILNSPVDVTGVANCAGSDQLSNGYGIVDKYKVTGTSLTLNNISRTLTKQ